MASFTDVQTELNASQTDLATLQADVDQKRAALLEAESKLNAASQRVFTAQSAACDAVAQISPDTLATVAQAIDAQAKISPEPMPEPAIIEAPKLG